MTPLTPDDLRCHLAAWQRDIAHAERMGGRWRRNLPTYRDHVAALERELAAAVLELPERKAVQMEIVWQSE